MTEAPIKARWKLALLMVAFVAGCAAPPSKPPTPKPLSSEGAARPPGQQGPAGAEPAGMQPGSAGGPGAPGSGEGYGAASANAAEVEEEEVAADGSTRLISSSRRAPPAATAAHDGAAAQGSGGGAMPPSSTPAARGEGHGGGGPKADPQGAGPAYSDMIGIEETESSGGPDTGAAAGARATATSGKPDAVDGATRLGVRGGVDESGATSGTPAPHAPTPQARDRAAPRENDILAQQLQEAAEKEKDPVLREKLWAEYRKYKAGL